MKIAARHSARTPPRFELVPMIDVTIFLLIFFMLFTTFKTNEAGVEVELPRAATGSEEIPTNLTVSVTRSGAIYLGDRLVTLEIFRTEARRVAAANPGATVTVRGDRQSNWEHIVAVMDAARQEGLSHFAFGTQPFDS